MRRSVIWYNAIMHFLIPINPNNGDPGWWQEHHKLIMVTNVSSTFREGPSDLLEVHCDTLSLTMYFQ